MERGARGAARRSETSSRPTKAGPTDVLRLACLGLSRFDIFAVFPILRGETGGRDGKKKKSRKHICPHNSGQAKVGHHFHFRRAQRFAVDWSKNGGIMRLEVTR